ncbi:MAG: hypothetical protein IKL84_03560 [Clostridia bacterium]|nr:hypothetical protein [Clostridia bacterium]
MDAARFSRLCYEAAANRTERGSGINTMGEKRLHMVLKRYYAPDETCHEHEVGRYIADILQGDEIIEVQTGSLWPMKAKIEYYLTQTDFRITIVHPILQKRWIRWIDPDEGTISERRRSPKKESIMTALADLIYILPYLTDPRLSLCFPVLEVDDFRLLNGRGAERKSHAARYERIPCALLDEISIRTVDDYRACLPAELPEQFTAPDFARMTKNASRTAYAAVKVLCAVGVLVPDGKIGRAQAYRRSE